MNDVTGYTRRGGEVPRTRRRDRGSTAVTICTPQLTFQLSRYIV
jgi:hypothetical protein